MWRPNGPALYLILCAGLAHAQGGGDLNPGLHVDPGAASRFQDLRVGLSIHWGPSSLTGYEISWSRGRHKSNQRQLIPVADYDQLYRKFNPVKFDPEEWARLAKRWGMRYLIPTGKHHDGFALWFSHVSDYDMENTPFRRDIMKELGDACRRNGIVFGSYYSNLDWHHPEWPAYDPEPGPLHRQPDSPVLDRYLEYMRAQLTELVRDYGVEILQFDGEWLKPWTHEIGSRMYRDLRALSSSLILSSRIDRGRQGARDPATGGWNWRQYAGDYEERERHVDWLSASGKGQKEDGGWSEHPWQAWITVDRRQWSWNPEPDLVTADELILDVVRTSGANGNLAINVGPRPDGSFHPDQIAIMDGLGKWLARYGESIYGTRGGPFRPAPWGVSTRKGKQAYLHLLQWEGGVLKLPPLRQKALSARLFDNDAAVRLRQTVSGIELQAPERGRSRLDTIVVLEFAGPPEMAPGKVDLR